MIQDILQIHPSSEFVRVRRRPALFDLELVPWQLDGKQKHGGGDDNCIWHSHIGAAAVDGARKRYPSGEVVGTINQGVGGRWRLLRLCKKFNSSSMKRRQLWSEEAIAASQQHIQKKMTDEVWMIGIFPSRDIQDESEFLLLRLVQLQRNYRKPD